MEKRDLTTDNQKPAGEGEPISDEKLRLYLLGTLNGDDRLKVDERLLADDELAERLALVESVLTDHYAAGKLDPAERELFESKFLVTDDRKQNLRLSAALSDYADTQASTVIPLPERSSWSEKLAGLFALNSPRAWAVAGSFAALLLLVGVTWFILKRPQESKPLIAKNEPTTVNSSEVVPQTGSPQSQPSPAPNASPSPETVPATVASFVLMPGALRSGGDMTRIAVPGGERDIVRLSLVVETPSEGTYQAELVTAEGQKVLVRPNLKITRNGHAKIILTVPARLLHTRDYQIKLTQQKPDGPSESVGRYYFRAQEE